MSDPFTVEKNHDGTITVDVDGSVDPAEALDLADAILETVRSND